MYAPIYIEEKTVPLASDSNPEVVQAAIMSLPSIAAAEVEREVVHNGFEWRIMQVAFHNARPGGADADVLGDTATAARPLRLNTHNLEVEPGAELVADVIQVGQYDLLASAIPGYDGGHVYARVLAHNAKGVSEPRISFPPSRVPAAQVPSAPRTARVEPKGETQLRIHWDEPLEDGGAPVSHYGVEWDTRMDFDSNSGAPLGAAIVLASVAAPLTDVQ